MLHIFLSIFGRLRGAVTISLQEFLKAATENNCLNAMAKWKETKWPHRLAAATIMPDSYTEKQMILIVKADMKLDGCDWAWSRAVKNSAFGTRNAKEFLKKIEQSNSEEATDLMK